MIRTVPGDLSVIAGSGWRAICIASDFSLGNESALTDDEEYHFGRELRNLLSGGYPWTGSGACMAAENEKIIGLIVKKTEWEHATLGTMAEALEVCRTICEQKHIEKIYMPMIGLDDHLRWDDVRLLIIRTFSASSTDVEIALSR